MIEKTLVGMKHTVIEFKNVIKVLVGQPVFALPQRFVDKGSTKHQAREY